MEKRFSDSKGEVTDGKETSAIAVEEIGVVPCEALATGDSFFARFQRFVGKYGIEQRGIEPVPEDERTDRSVLKPGFVFLSANMVVTTFAIGTIGVTIFGLGWWDGFLTILLGNGFACLTTCYFATFGPVFGMRQMVLSRYWFGHQGVKIITVLNAMSATCWSALNAMVGASLLHAVNNDIPGWAAIILIAAVNLLIILFGYRLVHYYEMFAWIPVFIIMMLVLGLFAASGDFENLPMGKGKREAAGILSFLAAIFGATLGWAPYAADYSCYQPRRSSRWKLFLGVFGGMTLSINFVMLLGFAVATATVNNPAYATAYQMEATGGLFAQVLLPRLGHFGEFCMVLLAFSVVAVNCPSTYSFCFMVQVISHHASIVPRSIWTIISVVVYTAVAIPGYSLFETVLENFMVCTSYWIAIYVVVGLTEHIIFRKGMSGYAPAAFNRPDQLPPSYAATASFCFGTLGAVLGMAQQYFVGPVAKLVGDFGGDVGFELALAFSFITYVPFRYMEVRYFKR